MEWRQYVKQIAPYVPGKSIELVKKELKLNEVIRLASNENPMGPSPKAIKAMQQSIESVNLYPDAAATEFREKLGNLYGVNIDEIITGNGADNIISILIQSYINEGDEVLYCTPTFPAYRANTILMGGKPVEIPLTKQLTFDLDQLKENITHKTKLIFICNPNNPTGTIVHDDALEKFVATVPEDVTVVLDEAYIEYVDDKNYTTGIDLYKKGYPVITIRTFSKFYGLAGLRIGYAVAKEHILEPMNRVREPFALNRVAIDAAVASLDDIQFKEEHFVMNKKGRQYLTEELESLGFTVYPSSTNFLFVNVKQNGEHLAEQLLQRGLIVRPTSGWGYDDFLRISIGTEIQNERLISALKEVV